MGQAFPRRNVRSPLLALPSAALVCAVAVCALQSHTAYASCLVPLPTVNPNRVASATQQDQVEAKTSPQRARVTAVAAGLPLERYGITTTIRRKRPVSPLPEVNPRRDAAAVELPVRKPDGSDPSIMLRPLLNYQLSKSDRNNLSAAVTAVRKHRYSQARATMKRIEDGAAQKLVHWLLLRSGAATASEIEDFRKDNPLWPDQRRLRRRAEGMLLADGVSHETILEFFANQEPTSGAGKAALARAYLETGDETRARNLVVSAWREHLLDGTTQKLIYSRFKDLLSAEDHKARIDKLLYQGRRHLIARALKVVALLDDSEEARKVKARAAVIRRSKGAGKLLEAVATDAQDVGVTFHRIQWLRRNGSQHEAWRLLKAVPNDHLALVDPDRWWAEREINSRDALNAGCPQIAYEIASQHGSGLDKRAGDAAFMAGWIALQFLDKPQLAKEHFLSFREAASSARTKARAEYWLGRAALALGSSNEAKSYFREAAEHRLAFHGILALHSLEPQSRELTVPVTPKPGATDLERLMAHDAVRALAMLQTTGHERFTRQYLYHLAASLNAPAEIALLAEYARLIGKFQASVRLAKIAVSRGLPLGDYAFPVGVIPEHKRLNDGVKPELLHALIRQESEFNFGAKSHAGARGLMQIMPRTARSIARSYKVRYRRKHLTEDPDYNVMLGAAHLRDLVDEFDGSYIMALAAYNAGGPRVYQWVDAFGDPRDPEVDPLDWVEQIPFTETRRYVQKILSDTQIYRARLAGAGHALQILDDLARGKGGSSVRILAAETSAERRSPCHLVGPDGSVQNICF
jgi:soluble lytic murein transglycosylase